MNQPTKRLEYVDALRGFIMLIIVYWHINLFSFDILKDINQINSFENIFLPFGMPLFFFISGFFAYRENQVWNKKNIINIISEKFKQLVIPTLLLSVLLIYIFNKSFVGYILSPAKYGFWFTFSLFEYYVVYIFISKFLEKIKHKKIYDLFFILIGLIVFSGTISNKALGLIGISDTFPNILGYNNFTILYTLYWELLQKEDFSFLNHT